MEQILHIALLIQNDILLLSLKLFCHSEHSEKSHISSFRKFHGGLKSLISASFLTLRQPFICFSLAMNH